MTIIIIVPHCLSNFTQETNNTNANQTGVQCSLTTSVSCYTIRPSQAFQPYKTHLAPHVSLAWGVRGGGWWCYKTKSWEMSLAISVMKSVQCSSLWYKVHCSLSGSLWVSRSLQIITASLARSEPAAAVFSSPVLSLIFPCCVNIDRKTVVQHTGCQDGGLTVYFLMVERRGEEREDIINIFPVCITVYVWLAGTDIPV